jgi:putative salt-induced outer membrane protein
MIDHDMTNFSRTIAVLVATTTLVSTAWAQQAPAVAAGLVAPTTSTSGSTEVATSGFEGRLAPNAAIANDTTESKISFGALASSGNSRSLATTGTGTFRLRRGKNQLSLAAAANYAKSRPQDAERMETTVENYQGKAQYDRFVASHIALCGAASLRHDQFQGLDVRLNLGRGIAYYFIDAKPTQLWAEIGYDYQYDLRSLDAVRDANAVRKANATAENPYERIGRKEDRHSGRLFLGYVTAFNDHVAFTSGFEYLQALSATENWRLLFDSGINASLSGRFSIATTFTVRYDHNPLPEIKKTDTTESVSLVYTLL